jgi:hypothetical protein
LTLRALAVDLVPGVGGVELDELDVAAGTIVTLPLPPASSRLRISSSTCRFQA